MDKLKSQINEAKTNKQTRLDEINKDCSDKKSALVKENEKEENNLKTMIQQEKTKLAKMRD